MMERTMGMRGGRSPVRVGNLLTAAVPALAERMLERAICREWAQTAGPEAARRTRPGALRQGTLEVSVDNSPWLQELTLRSAAIVLCGCAMTRSGPADGPDAAVDSPSPRIRDSRAAAYYYYSVAQMHARAGRVQDAIASLREAIDRDSDTAPLWVQLSQWLARANEPAKAVEAAHKAIALEPGNASPHLTLAEIFRRQRRFPEAEVELEKAIQLAPRSPDAYVA